MLKPVDPVELSLLPADEASAAVEEAAREAVFKGLKEGITVLVASLSAQAPSARHLRQIGMLSKIGTHALRGLGAYDFSEHRAERHRFALSKSPHTDAETVGATIMTDGMRALAASQRANQIAALSSAIQQISAIPGMEEDVERLRKELRELVSHPPGGPMESSSQDAGQVTSPDFEEA